MLRYLIAIMLIFILIFFLLIEGLGLPFGRQIVYFGILAVPCIFIASYFKRNDKIKAPKNFTIAFLLFFLFSVLSAIFGSNLQRSFESLLLLAAYFLIFIYVYNKKWDLEQKIINTIIVLSLIFTLYSLLLFFFPYNFLLPNNGYQFVYSGKLMHNHLGDFLLLTVIISLFYLFLKKNIHNSIRNLIVFTPFIIFSYSRSAYLTFTGMLLSLYLYFHNKRIYKNIWLHRIIITGIIVTGLVFLITVSRESSSSNISSVNKYLVSRQGLNPYKSLTNDHFEYINQAYLSFIHKPLLGVGPDNFIYASRTYTANPSFGTTFTAHNIFLDILVNNGLLAFIPFIYFAYLLLLKSKKNILFFVAVTITLIFQTDYIYSIYSFFLLFIVISASIYGEKEINIKTKYFFISALVIFSIAILIFLSNVMAAKNKYAISFFLYPLNRQTYLPLINGQYANNFATKNSLLYLYESNFPKDPFVLEDLGQLAEQNNDQLTALYYYEKSINLDFFNTFNLFEKIYLLKEKYEGKDSSIEFKNFIYKKTATVPHGYYLSPYFKNEFNRLCIKYNWKCINFNY